MIQAVPDVPADAARRSAWHRAIRLRGQAGNHLAQRQQVRAKRLDLRWHRGLSNGVRGFEARELGAHAAILQKRPTTGSCARRIMTTIRLPANAVSANPKSRPPSPLTSIPSTVRWLRIAPDITPIVRMAPYGANAGTNNKADATSSTTPEPMRPQGSTPSVLKIKTDSSAPVNLKNNVWSRMPATSNCRPQLITV